MNIKTLGDTFKEIERQHDVYLDGIIVLRIDGRNFKSFTRKYQKPFDDGIVTAMNVAAAALISDIGGTVVCAYTQSDECSIILKATGDTQHWFGGRKSKIESVASSVFTLAFADFLATEWSPSFDARAFSLPDEESAGKYLFWRQEDWRRNMVSMAARAVFSHKQLQHKSTSELKQMLLSAGVDVNDYPDIIKYGTLLTFGRGVTIEPAPHWLYEESVLS